MTNKKLSFSSFKLNKLIIKNRFIRASTYEGVSNKKGVPKRSLLGTYEELAKHNVGLILAGFNHISKESKAVQPRQCGIYLDEQIKAWTNIVKRVHQYDSKIFMQISHPGRQTTKSATKSKIWAPSNVKCTYFNTRPHVLNQQKINEIIKDYKTCAVNAKKAGFDGIQIHCAHGYLIHQFFSPHTNKRTDGYNGSIKNRFKFAHEIFKNVRKAVGPDFPIIIKISSKDDQKLEVLEVIEFIKLIDQTSLIDGIEISYGTMEYALNIFRGGAPIKTSLKYNPLFKFYPNFIKYLWIKFCFPSMKQKLIKFKENYNLEAAKQFLKYTNLPIILTGGLRTFQEMEDILANGITALSLSRPFIREPDLITKNYYNISKKSKCINCNLCAVMCDSNKSTRCYHINPI